MARLRTGRRWVLFSAFAGVAAALVVSLVGLFGVLGGKGIARVDFTVVADESRVSADAGATVPTLRVAVAAMISPETTQRYYGDLLRLIGKRVGRHTVFLQRKTYAEVNDLLERREVDLAFVCSGPYVTGHEEFGMELLALPVVGGQRVYHSYILARRDSAIDSLDGLAGKRFAFTDPDSNTGTLVPRFMFAKGGKSPASFFGETFFTYSHDNSIKAVAEGLADGAAVDSLIWNFLNATDPTYTARTKIVAESPPYGIPPVVVHPDLDEGLKRRLRKTFLTLHEDEEAAALMRELRIERFEEGNDSEYDSVREMQGWIALQG